ncbi:MAG: lytic transglycosylase domain-containing protein [Acidiferrobacter sp.]
MCWHNLTNAWVARLIAVGLCVAPLSAAARQPVSIWGHIPVHRDGFPNRFAAEVWLADMSQRLAALVPGRHFRVHFLEEVRYAALREGLRPRIVLAVIEVESGFNPYAISPKGALGLMQIMPFWTKRLGEPRANLFAMRTNLRAGCHILRHYLNRHNGNLFAALAAYNGSNGRRYYPDRVYAVLHARWFHQ